MTRKRPRGVGPGEAAALATLQPAGGEMLRAIYMRLQEAADEVLRTGQPVDACMEMRGGTVRVVLLPVGLAAAPAEGSA